MSQSSSSIDDSKVRILDILEDEEAIIRVRTKHHISLVFNSCIIDIFEKDNVVYTRQEYRNASEDDESSVGCVEVDHDIDTQALVTSDNDIVVLEETQLMCDEELPKFSCDLDMFEQTNQDLADALEYLDIYESGGTQLELYEYPEYTPNGIYIPSYLRAVACPDSQISDT